MMTLTPKAGAHTCTGDSESVRHLYEDLKAKRLLAPTAANSPMAVIRDSCHVHGRDVDAREGSCPFLDTAMYGSGRLRSTVYRK